MSANPAVVTVIVPDAANVTYLYPVYDPVEVLEKSAAPERPLNLLPLNVENVITKSRFRTPRTTQSLH
jgi:hypothetical protein